MDKIILFIVGLTFSEINTFHIVNNNFGTLVTHVLYKTVQLVIYEFMVF